MEDLKEKTDQYKDQFMSKAASVDQKSKFFTFSKPFTDSIDDGSLFTKVSKLLYQVIGGLFLAIPLYAAYKGIDGKIFDAPFKFVILALVFFAAFSASCWISFQIFFNRKDQLDALDNTKGYLASSIVSNFTRTMGECVAVFWGIVGTTVSILGLLIDGGDGLLSGAGIEGMGGGIVDVIFFPLCAFFILVFSRFVSEAIIALADIARNTKR
jgi:predicted PurR-regulated permease PerM